MTDIRKKWLIALLLLSMLAFTAAAEAMALPASLKTIKAEAFMGDRKVERVIVPEGTVEIGERAFAYSGLRRIVLPASLKTIAEDAFEGCFGLEVVAEEGTFAWYWAWEHGYLLPETTPAADFDYAAADGACVIYRYHGLNTEVRIPEEIDGCPVVAITGGAFEGRDDITRVIFPDSLKSIESFAFAGCAGLESVVLPRGLQVLEEMAFEYCVELEQVAAPLVWETIDSRGKLIDSPFYGCMNLRNIVLYEGIDEIPEFAFAKHTQVDGAYMNYNSLETVVIPSTVKKIGAAAFQDAAGIEQITLPEGLETISSGAFYGCSGLGQIDLPESLKVIESAAFGKCISLSRVTLPKGLEMLEMSAFVYCTELEEVETPLVWETGLDSEGNVIDSPFCDCMNLRRIVLCDGVTGIPGHAFARSSHNGSYYRNYNALSEIVIPAAVDTIDPSAFEGCDGLTIYGTPGTRAESYAAENGYGFMEVE